MKGITEERLRELVRQNHNDLEYINPDEAWEALEEINHWQPIETAPKDRPIRLFVNFSGVKEGYQTEGYISEANRHLYTHWQELPEDPK